MRKQEPHQDVSEMTAIPRRLQEQDWNYEATGEGRGVWEAGGGREAGGFGTQTKMAEQCESVQGGDEWWGLQAGVESVLESVGIDAAASEINWVDLERC